MNTNRIKFVVVFLILAFAYLIVSDKLLNQPTDAVFGTESQTPWKTAASTILSPFRYILIGPMLPFIEFLRQDSDTPPPFFLAGFAFYWTILALFFHFLIGKIKATR